MIGVDAVLARVCKLDAAGRERRRGALARLIGRAMSIRETSTGVRLAFSSTADAERVAELVRGECGCCPTFTYASHLAPDGTLLLDIQARGAEIPLLKALYLGLERDRDGHDRSEHR